MTSLEIAAHTALVLETHHRHSTQAEAAEHVAELVTHLAQQSVPLSALGQVIVTHRDWSLQTQLRFREALGCEVKFVALDTQARDFDAQQMGFFAVDSHRCHWVAFTHIGCRPSRHWLQELLRPFGRRHPPMVVAGRSSYDDQLVGSALTSLDFLYFTITDRYQIARNFDAHNVAFRCDVFGRLTCPAQAGIQQIHSEVMGLALSSAGVPVHFAPEAHTVHDRPKLERHLSLRWQRAHAAVSLTPHLVHAHFPGSLQWIAHTGPLAPLCLLGLRTWTSLRTLNHQSTPPVRGLRRLAAWGLIMGVSAVDATGVLVASLRGWRKATHRKGPSVGTLAVVVGGLTACLIVGASTAAGFAWVSESLSLSLCSKNPSHPHCKSRERGE